MGASGRGLWSQVERAVRSITMVADVGAKRLLKLTAVEGQEHSRHSPRTLFDAGVAFGAGIGVRMILTQSLARIASQTAGNLVLPVADRKACSSTAVGEID